MMRLFLLPLCLSVLCLSSLPGFAQQPGPGRETPSYHWENVEIAGGGFIDGIIFHPSAKNIRYCRTDMGGAYRWDQAAKRWQPMLDFLSYEDRNLMGIESIAVDPNDSNFVILACGTYTNPRTGNGAILRSFDQGKTFQRTDVAFKFGGNENGRGNGERMAVEPTNGNTIYLGTRLNGLWRSVDKGLTWNPVQSFPDITEATASSAPTPGAPTPVSPAPVASPTNTPGSPADPSLPAPGSPAADSFRQRMAFFQNRGSGIVVCLFDPRHGAPNKAVTSGAAKKVSTIYVAVSLMGRDNFFRSADGGVSWQPVPGEPTAYRPTHAILSSDGMIYISYGDNPGPRKMKDGAVWKFNTNTGEWIDVTPDKPISGSREFGYAAVSVDASHPATLIASSFGRSSALGGEEIFRSLDAGKTWKPIMKTSSFDDTLAPYVRHTQIHWLFDIEIDPFNSDHAMFTTGYGGHETFNLSAIDQDKPIPDPVHWTVMSTGVEETVALELLSPPSGPPLISAIGDYGGFVHWDLDKPVPEGNFTNPHFGNTDGIACAQNDPHIIVRVGAASHNIQNQNIGYSLDGGKNWQLPGTMPQPGSQHGHIAVSADGATWIWTPQRSPVYVTHDHGASWQTAQGIKDNLRVIADKINSKRFYALDLREGQLYSSLDNGNTFTTQPLPPGITLAKPGTERGDNRGGQDRVYATPGRQGDLWIAAFDGLYHSTDAGKTFSKAKDITEIHAFGFGKGPTEAAYPSLYLVGVVNGLRAIFRSDDLAQAWMRINDDRHQWGLILQITGDPKVHGRVYVGTHGRGIFYGDENQ